MMLKILAYRLEYNSIAHRSSSKLILKVFKTSFKDKRTRVPWYPRGIETASLTKQNIENISVRLPSTEELTSSERLLEEWILFLCAFWIMTMRTPMWNHFQPNLLNLSLLLFCLQSDHSIFTQFLSNDLN